MTENTDIHRLLDDAFRSIDMTADAQDLKEEMRANLLARAAELEEAGSTPADAARRAVAELGDVRDLVAESTDAAATTPREDYAALQQRHRVKPKVGYVVRAVVWSLAAIGCVTLIPTDGAPGVVYADERYYNSCSFDYGGPAPEGFWILAGGQRLLNVLVFVPSGALLVLVLGRWRTAFWTVPIGLLGLGLVSVGVEATQQVLSRLDRSCDVTDVVDNLTGAGLGVLLGIALLPLVRPWRGRRVVLSAQLKGAGIGEGTTGLWLRGTGGNGEITAFATSYQHPLRGDTGWERREVELLVGHTTEQLVFGAALGAPGTLWVDAIELRAIGTGTLAAPSAAARAYLDAALAQERGQTLPRLFVPQQDVIHMVVLPAVRGHARAAQQAALLERRQRLRVAVAYGAAALEDWIELLELGMQERAGELRRQK